MTSALRRRCSTPTAPCWANYLTPNAQALLWGVSLDDARIHMSVIGCEIPKELTHSAGLQSRVWAFSQDGKGCREVQRAFEEETTNTRELLTRELHGHVWEALASPHANHVLQKSISMIRPSASQYVIDEILSISSGAVRASKHQYGCRVIQRLLEHCRPDQTDAIVEDILANATELSTSSYGRHVIGCILESCSNHHQQRLLGLVIASCHDLAYDLYGRAVLSNSLEVASGHAMDAFRASLLEEPRALAQMAQCKYGYSGAVLLLEELPLSERSQLWNDAAAEAPELAQNRYAHIVAKKVDVSPE